MTRHGLGLIPQKIFLVLETHGADVVTPRNGNLCLSWAVWLGTYLTVPRRLGHTRKPEHIPKFYCSSSLTKERQTVCSSQWAIIPSLQFLMDVVVSGVQLVSFSSFFPCKLGRSVYSKYCHLVDKAMPAPHRRNYRYQWTYSAPCFLIENLLTDNPVLCT